MRALYVCPISPLTTRNTLTKTGRPFYLKGAYCYNKFMAIEGIEKYIRMYYGKEKNQ